MKNKKLANWKYREVRDYLDAHKPDIRQNMLGIHGREGMFDYIFNALYSHPDIDWAEVPDGGHCELVIPSSDAVDGIAQSWFPSDRMVQECLKLDREVQARSP